jgi:hypothetical protein
VVSRAGDLGRPQKKECLIFTNKANMLLKTSTVQLTLKQIQLFAEVRVLGFVGKVEKSL